MPRPDTPDPQLVPLLGRRRAFLLSSRSQLRLSLWAVGLALLLLVPLNVALYVASVESTERILVDVPDLAESLRTRDRLQAYLVLGGSIVFLLGVFTLGILESHRTAGAARKLTRATSEFGRGRFGTRVALRRGDCLVDLAARFNEMAGEISRRAADDRQDLERIAAEVERLGAAGPAPDLAARIRAVAQRRTDPE